MNGCGLLAVWRSRKTIKNNEFLIWEYGAHRVLSQLDLMKYLKANGVLQGILLSIFILITEFGVKVVECEFIVGGLRDKCQFTPNARVNITIKGTGLPSTKYTIPSVRIATKLFKKFVFECQTYLSQPMTNGCVKRGEQ